LIAEQADMAMSLHSEFQARLVPSFKPTATEALVDVFMHS